MYMPNKDKLIKQGIRYTDKLFDEIVKRLEKGVRASDTLEAFLEKTAGYTTGNPLVESGYYDSMLNSGDDSCISVLVYIMAALLFFCQAHPESAAEYPAQSPSEFRPECRTFPHRNYDRQSHLCG